MFAGKDLEDDKTNIEKEGMMHVLLRLMGGVKVIKSTIKAKVTSRVVQQDQQIFAQAHAACMMIHAAPRFDTAAEVRNMDVEQLRELKTYLNSKDKTTNAVKMKQFYEHLATYRNLLTINEKIMLSMDQLKTMVTNDLEENFANEAGNVDINIMKDLVTATFAVKEAQQ